MQMQPKVSVEALQDEVIRLNKVIQGSSIEPSVTPVCTIRITTCSIGPSRWMIRCVIALSGT